jgi:hypothetical protein
MSRDPFSRAARAGAFVLTVAAIALACDDGVGVQAPPPDFALTPGNAALIAGGTLRFGIVWQGAAPPGAHVEWSVAPSSLGVVDSGGTFRATGSGIGVYAATVRSALGTQTRVAQLTVLGRDCGGTIVLTPASGSVAVGGRLQLRGALATGPECVLVEGEALIYRSLDPAVASVDSVGVVTGLAPGIARVTVAARANPTVFALAQVTVLVSGGFGDPPVVSPAFVSLVPGDTVRLRASYNVRPNAPVGTTRSVTFASRDSAVATVDSGGLVRAWRAGVTSVMVRAVADTAVFTAVPVTVRTP